jgi:methylthioribulose-1-phosphate dehydratase
MVVDFQTAATQLIEAGRELHALGMVPATSGNFSARLDDGRIAITVSGRHKGRLTEADIMLLDAGGRALDQRRPSAETGLHLQLYRRFPMTRGILHPHSQAATLTAASVFSYDSGRCWLNRVLEIRGEALLIGQFHPSILLSWVVKHTT